MFTKRARPKAQATNSSARARTDGDATSAIPSVKQDDAPVAESPSALAAKLKKSKKSKKTQLSFGGDDEVRLINQKFLHSNADGLKEGDGEVFQVKKSNLSQKVALGRHPAYVFYRVMRMGINSMI